MSFQMYSPRGSAANGSIHALYHAGVTMLQMYPSSDFAFHARHSTVCTPWDQFKRLIPGHDTRPSWHIVDHKLDHSVPHTQKQG